MKTTWRTIALGITMMAGAVQADAAQEIRIRPGKPWVHKDSGLAFPAAIGSFVRRDMTDISDGKRIDIAATYDDPTTSSVATLYLYRPAMPEPALWFDISNWFLQRNDRFGVVKADGGPTTFQIATTQGSAALRQSYAISATGRSSGVAIAPIGRWLIKLRMTSRALEPPTLDRAMRDFLVGMPWPKKMPPAPDSLPLGPCSTPLTTTRAEEIKQVGAVILVGAMNGSLSTETAKDAPAEAPASLCRDDSRPDAAHPLYQLDEGRTGYVMAIGDSGTLLSVRDDRASAMIASELSDGKTEAAAPFYRVTMMSPERWEQYSAYAQLPPLDQAMENTRQSDPLSVTTILEKGSKIILNSKSFQ